MAMTYIYVSWPTYFQTYKLRCLSWAYAYFYFLIPVFYDENVVVP